MKIDILNECKRGEGATIFSGDNWKEKKQTIE